MMHILISTISIEKKLCIYVYVLCTLLGATFYWWTKIYTNGPRYITMHKCGRVPQWKIIMGFSSTRKREKKRTMRRKIEVAMGIVVLQYQTGNGWIHDQNILL